MKKNRILKIAITFVIVVTAIGYYAYYEFNRTNDSLKNKQPAYVVSPSMIIDEFSKNSTAALQKYVDKVIEVEGQVKNIETTEKNDVTIVLGEENNMSSLRFSLDSNETKEANIIKINAKVRLKGMCTGYNADEMGLGSDILLNRAIIVTNKNN